MLRTTTAQALVPLLMLAGCAAPTYDLDTGRLDAARFVIGDAGLAQLYAERVSDERELHGDPGPMLLCRSDADVHHVRVYYPDRLIRNLERNDPACGLSQHNLHDFVSFVEELDHLLLLVAAWRSGRPVSGL